MFEPFVVGTPDATHGWDTVKDLQGLGQTVEGLETLVEQLGEDA